MYDESVREGRCDLGSERCGYCLKGIASQQRWRPGGVMWLAISALTHRSIVYLSVKSSFGQLMMGPWGPKSPRPPLPKSPANRRIVKPGEKEKRTYKSRAKWKPQDSSS